MSILSRGIACVALSWLLLAPAAAAEPISTTIQLPGAPAFSPELRARLRAGASTLISAAPPRTAHLNADGSPRYVNRLVLESSPYLQQHAFNPVNWYAWGEEAFAAAAQSNRPILLSIGYSTCHWCHVMERECFENEAIARAINESFVAIKVDREERPDIDATYVAAVERMTGSAGWPLTVFLTPDRKPFYGGTYFPPADQGDTPGLPKLLTTVANVWTTRHDQVLEASASLTAALQPAPASAAVSLRSETLRNAYEQLRRGFDAANGGFGRAPNGRGPKFPQAHQLQFLLRYSQRSGDPEARRMALETLEHMARGGIHDQLGGGFHRYSTDPQWHVPHYEKMLYDQAINARAYLEAYQATGTDLYAQVARDIFGYVLHDLAAPGGGFYAAEDADSEGEEGRFYTWSRAEIVTAAGDRGALIADYFGITDSSRRGPLTTPAALGDFATQHHVDPAALSGTVAAARLRLLEARNRRSRPLRDDKILTAWNGLMISSLAYGSEVLSDPHYATAAARAADFILDHLQRDGRLLHSERAGHTGTAGFLDDYAFFITGLTDLYAATFEGRWLREADRLTRDMLRLFADPERGTWRYGAGDAETLIAAGEQPEDGALPSAQSMAALTLLRIGRLTMNDSFEAAGRTLLDGRSQDLVHAPTAYTQMLMALDFSLGPTREIVIAGRRDDPAVERLLAEVRRHYLPRSVLALHAPGDGAIEALVPFLKEQGMLNGKPTAYVCEHYVCKLPTNDPAQLRKLLTG